MGPATDNSKSVEKSEAITLASKLSIKDSISHIAVSLGEIIKGGFARCDKTP